MDVLWSGVILKGFGISMWTVSCTVAAGGLFPWGIIDYRGRSHRAERDKNAKVIKSIEPVTKELILEKTLVTTLKNAKDMELTLINDLLAGHPKGYNINFSWMLNGWFTSAKEQHATWKSVTQKKTRTVEKDYEASVRASLDKVRAIAIKEGIKPAYLSSSYMVMKTLNGQPVESYDEDVLYDLLGTYLYGANPLSHALYDVIEHTITKRGVSEYKVLPRRF